MSLKKTRTVKCIWCGAPYEGLSNMDTCKRCSKIAKRTFIKDGIPERELVGVKPRFEKTRQMRAQIKKEIEKGYLTTVKEISERVGCSNEMVKKVARELGVKMDNSKLDAKAISKAIADKFGRFERFPCAPKGWR